MSDDQSNEKLLQVQLDLVNERLSHLMTLSEQAARKKDIFVFFLGLMLLIFSGGFVMMYRIDKLGNTSNLHWASHEETVTGLSEFGKADYPLNSHHWSLSVSDGFF